MSLCEPPKELAESMSLKSGGGAVEGSDIASLLKSEIMRLIGTSYRSITLIN